MEEAKPVIMTDGSQTLEFECISFCAKYLFSTERVISGNLSWICTKIASAASDGTEYAGAYYKFK